MFVTMNHIAATAGEIPPLAARFANRARLVDAMPGFRSFELLLPVTLQGAHGSPAPDVIVTTFWDSKGSFDAWVQSEERQRAHPGFRLRVFW